jgi:hypothetical protein
MKLGSNVGVLRVGSTAVAAVKRGTDRVYDADVAAFQKASDAADVTGIMDLVDYLKGQSLWDYARFYPMKSSQNAGSGSTVYGLGGLTSNNMTLVNSPTWGSDGVTFDAASSQYGNCGTIGIGGDVEAYVRLAFTDAAGVYGSLSGYYAASGANHRYFLADRLDSGQFRTLRSLTGTGGAVNTTLSSDAVDTTEDQTVVFSLPSGEDVNIFQNNTDLTEVITQVGEQGIQTLPGDLYFAARNNAPAGSPLGYLSMTGGCFCILDTVTTSTQRETITDLINAL